MTGSSPRGRGTRCTARDGRRFFRFIPAWAGNTIATARDKPPPSVHPRVGGEHMPGCVCSMLNLGSSPRGRGTLPMSC